MRRFHIEVTLNGGTHRADDAGFLTLGILYPSGHADRQRKLATIFGLRQSHRNVPTTGRHQFTREEKALTTEFPDVLENLLDVQLSGAKTFPPEAFDLGSQINLEL